MALEIETDNLYVEYALVNESYSHSFGTRKVTGYEILKIMAYIPAIDDWLDVSHLSEFESAANNVVSKELQ